MPKSCSVRKLTRHDLPMILAWRNHASVRAFMLTQHEISAEEHLEWFLRSDSNPHRALLIIEESKHALGFVQFSETAPGEIANWGFYVRPDAEKGSGQKLGAAALDYAFDALHLRKVCGQAIESNKASIGLHTKLGFLQEGATQSERGADGISRTLICFGLLHNQWRDHANGPRRI